MSKKKQPDWVARGISIAALVVSVFSFSLAVCAYVQTTRPHTIFDETCTKLDLLDKRIDQAESYIQLWTEKGPSPGIDLVGCEDNLTRARSLRDQAESSLMRNQCEQAKEYILQADDLASSVPQYPHRIPSGVNWGLIGGIIAAALVGLFLLLFLLFGRRRKRGDPEQNPGSRPDDQSHTLDDPAK
jgi:hypothetical protein